MKGLVSAVQRFSLHDGDGIRTTVFLMGCPLRCPWCANPENMSCERKRYRDQNGLWKYYGKLYSAQELADLVCRDMDYYGKNGGVTFSGGEPLMQAAFLKEAVPLIKRNNIGICIETSLFADWKIIDWIMPHLSQLFVDLKILDKEKCRKYLGGDAQLYDSNIRKLARIRIPNTVIRIPVVRGYTDPYENIQKAVQTVRIVRPKRVELFSVHNLGKPKYESLGLPYQDFEKISEEELKAVSSQIEKAGVRTVICQL